VDNVEIHSILHSFGKRVPPGSSLILIGGSALALLGSPRQTIDIDFIGDDIKPSVLHKIIMQAARDLKINVEPVPFGSFIPLPKDSEKRKIRIGQFGNLEVFIADPYSIALSKLDRGLDTDFDDIVFLIQKQHITVDELERITNDVLSKADKFDFNPDIASHLHELKNRLK
jgi:hypothetical protein